MKSIKQQAQAAKTLTSTLASASAKLAAAKQSLTQAGAALQHERQQKFKTATAKENQRKRIVTLREALRAAKTAERHARIDHRRAEKALLRGPKVHLLSITTARARSAGAHLDMTGKDARIIPSYDDSKIVREPAKHVWKGTQKECYYSRSRSQDIEYVRAIRDNHIASYVVIDGQWARGVVHTTEWTLKAPPSMSWSVKDGSLVISAAPSKLVPTTGVVVSIPESPSISGLSLAEQSYDTAYARLRDQQYLRGPKVRAAVRALSRHNKLGWKVGIEKFNGRDLTFVQRRDGEKYHFSAADTTYSAAAVSARVQEALNAFAQRDNDKEAIRLATEQEAQIAHDLHNTRVTLDDSRKAGNCVEGSLAFAERKLHLSRNEILSAGYLFSVPAERLLSVASGDKTQVMRAVRVAWLRETTVSI